MWRDRAHTKFGRSYLDRIATLLLSLCVWVSESYLVFIANTVLIDGLDHALLRGLQLRHGESSSVFWCYLGVRLCPLLRSARAYLCAEIKPEREVNATPRKDSAQTLPFSEPHSSQVHQHGLGKYVCMRTYVRNDVLCVRSYFRCKSTLLSSSPNPSM
jgi:hypothetical protein